MLNKAALLPDWILTLQTTLFLPLDIALQLCTASLKPCRLFLVRQFAWSYIRPDHSCWHDIWKRLSGTFLQILPTWILEVKGQGHCMYFRSYSNYVFTLICIFFLKRPHIYLLVIKKKKIYIFLDYDIFTNLNYQINHLSPSSWPTTAVFNNLLSF